MAGMRLGIPNSNKPFIDIVFGNCYSHDWGDIWFGVELFVLVPGVVSNTALLWLFLRERKTLSASQVLGINLFVMDLIFLSVSPVSLAQEMWTREEFKRNLSAADWELSTHSYRVEIARNTVSMFNLIGCPLLLTCMCAERYLAVLRPVLYLRVRKWEYRVAVSVVVWVITLSFCLACGLEENVSFIMVPASFIISCLFLIMLGCLGSVVWSLQQQSPAQTSSANKSHSESSLKRRAVINVLAVVVPAVTSYLPVLLMVPVVLYLYYTYKTMNRLMCKVFESAVACPKFGVLIGPLFYLSKARKLKNVLSMWSRKDIK